MNFKEGSRVRIKKDLVVEKVYDNSYIFVNDMTKYKGKDAIISKICSDYYRLNIDNMRWKWTDDMLEPIEENNIEKDDIVEVNYSTLGKVQGKVLDINVRLKNDKEEINFSNVCAIKIDNVILLANKDDLKLVKKYKQTGEYNYGSEVCKYETKGNKTIITLPSGTTASVECFEGNKYDLELGLKLAYFKAKFKETSNRVEEKSNAERGVKNF